MRYKAFRVPIAGIETLHFNGCVDISGCPMRLALTPVRKEIAIAFLGGIFQECEKQMSIPLVQEIKPCS